MRSESVFKLSINGLKCLSDDGKKWTFSSLFSSLSVRISAYFLSVVRLDLPVFLDVSEQNDIVSFWFLSALFLSPHTLTVTSPVVYCYVTNQTVLTCPCSHVARYSFLCILILHHPYERSVMIPPYPLEFLRLLSYSMVASSELIQLAVLFSLVSSRSPWVCSNSSFE